MQPLGSSRSTTDADRVLELDARVAQAGAGALAALERTLVLSSRAERSRILDALRRIRKGRLPAAVDGAADAELARLRHAQAAATAMRDAFTRTFAAETARIDRAIAALAAQDRFQEAVLWQNRRAFHDAIEWLVRHPDATGQHARSSRRLVAGYLQRYCTKNDTIGFFGPVGWARLVPDGPPLCVRPGKNLLASREVYFEAWALDAVARILASAGGVRRWLPPRPLPFHDLDGDFVRLPLADLWRRESDGPRALSSSERCVLEACDGRRTPRAIADATGLDEADVIDCLAELDRDGIVSWTLETPSDLHPERTLRRLLEGIGDAEARADGLGSLDELDDARRAVADAAGDVARLDRALGTIEEIFTRLTGRAPTRAGGATYAARTLVHEDCRRDVDVEIGSDVVRRLGPPLSLVLACARWFTHDVARRYRAAFAEVFRTFPASSSGCVDLHAFALRALPLLEDASHSPPARAAAELQARWADVLGLDAYVPGPLRRRVQVTSETLRPRVEAAFAAPHAGWTSARYASPDVLIAARGIDAVAQGDYLLVVGELHLFNTLELAVFVAQHPDPQALLRARAVDVPEPCVVAVPSKQTGSSRHAPSLVLPEDIYFAHDASPPGRATGRIVRVGELIVEAAGTALQVRTRDGRQVFDVIDFFAPTLASRCLALPPLLPPAPHTPRVTVDGVVICRERWLVPAELPFAGACDAAARFLGARAWASARGLPRFLFVKAPVEAKPVYVDLESPVSIDLLSRLAQRSVEREAGAATLSVTEMLPTCDETWLADGQGHRYTCELRLVTLDPEPWRPPSSAR